MAIITVHVVIISYASESEIESEANAYSLIQKITKDCNSLRSAYLQCRDYSTFEEYVNRVCSHSNVPSLPESPPLPSALNKLLEKMDKVCSNRQLSGVYDVCLSLLNS